MRQERIVETVRTCGSLENEPTTASAETVSAASFRRFLKVFWTFGKMSESSDFFVEMRVRQFAL